MYYSQIEKKRWINDPEGGKLIDFKCPTCQFYKIYNIIYNFQKNLITYLNNTSYYQQNIDSYFVEYFEILNEYDFLSNQENLNILLISEKPNPLSKSISKWLFGDSSWYGDKYTPS